MKRKRSNCDQGNQPHSQPQDNRHPPPSRLQPPPQPRRRKRRSDAADDIIQEYYNKLKSTKHRTKAYSHELMKFAITMQGYSTRSYNFMRETFHDALPCFRTLNRHLAKLDAKPGYSRSALSLIKGKVEELEISNKKLFLSLAIDDISIREHIEVKGSSVYGYVDIGEGPGKTPVTHAMVLLCTSLMSSWKIPIAFFLIGNSFSGKERADLVSTAIEKLKESGAYITNIVCDNPKVNHSMIKHLGAKLDPEDVNPTLNVKNIDGSDIHVLLDPTHLLKLTRNTLGKL